MLALGLDPSLSGFGFAVHDPDAQGRARRVVSFHEKTLPSTVMVARFMHLRSVVRSILDEYPIDIVGIESPAYDAGPFQTIHYGLMQFSLEAIFEKRIDCVTFDPTTLKYLAKGDPIRNKGQMGKLEMQRFVQLDTMDAELIDNNEADAYSVSYFSARFRQLHQGIIGPDDLSPSERRKFVTVSRQKKTVIGKKTVQTGHLFRENKLFFQFSKIPPGDISLPRRDQIPTNILNYLESMDSSVTSK